MVIDAPLLYDTLCILLYTNTEDTKQLVGDVVELYDKYIQKGKILNADVSEIYVRIIKDILGNELDVKNKAEMLQVFGRVDQHELVRKDPNVLARLKEIVDNAETISPGRISSLKSHIKKRLLVLKGIENLKHMFSTSSRMLNVNDSPSEETMFVDLVNNAKELVEIFEAHHSADAKSISFINMSDKESIARGLAEYKAKRSRRGTVLGIQQIGKLFGSALGPCPGQPVGFAALSHNYKSGMMLDFARWIAMYNHPPSGINKPAAIVFNSVENEIHENMMLMFKSAYYNAFKKPTNELTDEEVITAIVQLFSKNGFELLVFRDDPEEFGWSQWKKRHDELRKKYHLVGSFTDYLGLMDMGTGDNRAKLMQELLSKIKNYGLRYNMQTYNCFQLGSDAAMEAKSGKTNIVQRFNQSHLADCRQIKSELDVLIFLHIETNHLGVKYLTGWLDKLKYASMPCAEDRYFAIPFTEHGLLDDIYGMSTHVPDIYNVSASSVNSSNKSLF